MQLLPAMWAHLRQNEQKTTHYTPGQPTHAQPLYAQDSTIKEEYESIKRENDILRKINKAQDEILERKMIAVVEEVNGGVAIIHMNKDGSIKRIEKR